MGLSLAVNCEIRRDVTVLGLGNILLGDDGVGVHVARRLAEDPARPEGLCALDGGTLGFRLLSALTQADAVIIVDAALLGEPAGALRLLDQSALAAHIGRAGPTSAHEAGLLGLLSLAMLDGWAPSRFALLCIQPQHIDWGETLSDAVALSVPGACSKIIETFGDWQAAA